MPLDKVIVTHVDRMDEIEDALIKDIDSEIDNINIDELVNDVEGALAEVVDHIFARIVDVYYVQSAEEGLKFAKNVLKDGSVEVADSNDPQLNEDLDLRGESG